MREEEESLLIVGLSFLALWHLSFRELLTLGDGSQSLPDTTLWRGSLKHKSGSVCGISAGDCLHPQANRAGPSDVPLKAQVSF